MVSLTADRRLENGKRLITLKLTGRVAICRNLCRTRDSEIRMLFDLYLRSNPWVECPKLEHRGKYVLGVVLGVVLPN